MKSVKVIIMVCAALALAATHSVAGQYKIKISGVTYTNNSVLNIIVPFKFTNRDILGNRDIVGQIATNKGTQLLYDTSGQIFVADACGNSLLQFPIGLLILDSPDVKCTPEVTNGSLTEKACSIPINFLGLGGTAVVDFKTLISSKGTNLLATATGVFAGPTGPGTFTISLAGAFKKPTNCP